VRELGYSPAFGVTVNLLYSAVASALFLWIVVRWLRRRDRTTGRPKSGPD
jgi:membrane protein implicated in regulation of membrane protease activity